MDNMEDISQSPEVLEFYQWLAEINPHLELGEVPELEPFTPEELEQLEEAGRAYAQELLEQDAIPELGDIDLEERFLEHEPALDVEKNIDFDR